MEQPTPPPWCAESEPRRLRPVVGFITQGDDGPGNVAHDAVAARLDDLAERFGQRLARLERAGLPVAGSSDFWLRLTLVDGDDAVIGFPWYDTFAEIDHFLVHVLQGVNSGDGWFDEDQGWELHTWFTASSLHLREAVTGFNVVTEREPFTLRAAALRKEVPEAIALLAGRLGSDPWTGAR